MVVVGRLFEYVSGPKSELEMGNDQIFFRRRLRGK